jgi:uncharacterized protein YecE (DUF72 family)
VGVAGLRAAPRARLFAELDCVEVVELGQAPGAPGVAVLRKWRAEAPARFAFIAVAPPRLHETMRHDAGSEAALAEAVQALGAAAVLYPTLPAVSPDPRNREAITAVLRATPGGARAVWEPHGPWEYADAAALATRAGAVLAVDPLNLAAPYETEKVPPPPGPIGYFRLPLVPGMRSGYDPERLEEIALALAGYEEAWVIFAHGEAWRDARRFRKLLAGEAPGAADAEDEEPEGDGANGEPADEDDAAGDEGDAGDDDDDDDGDPEDDGEDDAED